MLYGIFPENQSPFLHNHSIIITIRKYNIYTILSPHSPSIVTFHLIYYLKMSVSAAFSHLGRFHPGSWNIIQSSRAYSRPFPHLPLSLVICHIGGADARCSDRVPLLGFLQSRDCALAGTQSWCHGSWVSHTRRHTSSICLINSDVIFAHSAKDACWFSPLWRHWLSLCS